MMAYESRIFSIDPKVEKRIHPEALRVLSNWENLELLMLPTKLTATDAYGHLNDNERTEFKSCIDQIAEGLKTCMDIGDKVPLYDFHFGDVFFQRGIISEFRRKSWFPLFSLKLLLEKACSRKLEKERREVEEAREKKRREEEQERQEAAKAEEERKRQIEKAEQERKEKEEQKRKQAEKAEQEREKIESEKRWWAAYKALNIPCTNASTYLKPEEHEEFADSILGAVDAYLDKKESYILDSRADAYLLWINEINKRKEEERQQLVDNLAAREFNNSLSKHIAKLKSKLNNRPRDLQNYFTAKIQDKRYTGHNFDYVLDDEQERVFDATLVRVANDKLKQIIPPDLLEFIEIPSTYYRLYFPLPSISYSFEGIPCLDFNFDIFVTAHAEVLLKPKVKKFGICSFNLPAEKEGNVLIPLEEPKLLGYFHILLTPEELGGYVPWGTIPLVLLNWLFKGGTKPPGITISEASDDSITYKVQKFKEEVDIPDKFADYLKNIGSFDEMINMGIVNEKVGSVVRSLDGQKPESSKELKTLKSKKAQALQLFSEGRRPSDSEVKTLGIKPESSYRYYQQWKKAHNRS